MWLSVTITVFLTMQTRIYVCYIQHIHIYVIYNIFGKKKKVGELYSSCNKSSCLKVEVLNTRNQKYISGIYVRVHMYIYVQYINGNRCNV